MMHPMILMLKSGLQENHTEQKSDFVFRAQCSEWVSNEFGCGYRASFSALRISQELKVV